MYAYTYIFLGILYIYIHTHTHIIYTYTHTHTQPNVSSEYPTVFGHESNVCYLRALDGCYQRFAAKYKLSTKRDFHLGEVDHVVLHSPYNKLVKKSGARMLYNDFIKNPDLPVFRKHSADLSKFKSLLPEHTYEHKEIEKTFIELAKPMYATKVEPSVFLPQELGNSYTASMYTGLLSLLHSWHKARPGAQVDTDENAKGKTVLLFSYGSGLASTLFTIKCVGPTGHVAQAANLTQRLESRKFVTPQVQLVCRPLSYSCMRP